MRLISSAVATCCAQPVSPGGSTFDPVAIIFGRADIRRLWGILGDILRDTLADPVQGRALRLGRRGVEACP